jgi:hypothetical protein
MGNDDRPPDALLRLAEFFEISADRLVNAPFQELLVHEIADAARFDRVEQKIKGQSRTLRAVESGAVVDITTGEPSTDSKKSTIAQIPHNQPKGALAEMGERRLCKPEVTGSIPVRSTGLGSTNAGLTEWKSLGPCEDSCSAAPVSR